MNNLWGKTLREISGRDFESEEEWMLWLGECSLYGMRACQGARVADWVIQQWWTLSLDDEHDDDCTMILPGMH
jgi:hypothetical protein